MLRCIVAFGLASALQATAAQGQQIPNYRDICFNPQIRAAMLSGLQGRDRQEAELELADRCPRLDLPATPVIDAVDSRPEANHSKQVNDARYSADGKRIVSASSDGSVRVWDAESGKPLLRIVISDNDAIADYSQRRYVRSAVFVGEGNLIAVATDRSPVQLFDAAGGQPRGEIAYDMSGDGPKFPPKLLPLRDGSVLLAGPHTEIKAVDPASLSVRWSLPPSGADISAAARSDSASLLAISSVARRVALFRMEGNDPPAVVDLAGRGTPRALSFSNDGKLLAVAAGGTAQIYSVTDRRVQRVIDEHPFYSLFAVRFTPDGKHLITCRTHPVLRSVETGEIVRHFGPFNDLCHTIDISPDGRFALTTSLGTDLRIWEIATGTFYRRIGASLKPNP